MKSKRNIVLCIDHNYIFPCGITLTSLLENNRDLDLTIFIIGLDFDQNDCISIKNISKIYDVEINIILVEKTFLEKYDLPLTGLASSKYITLAAYIRLFLSDILPEDIDEVLYLDCDIYVAKSLSKLFEISLENYSLAGVVDQHIFLPSISEYYSRLEYETKQYYINSGVLFINLKYWRIHNLVNKFILYIKMNRDKIKYHDQDVINAVLHDTFYLLPFSYNMQSGFYEKQIVEKLISLGKPFNEDIIIGLNMPYIVHFTKYYSKPWFKGNFHPMVYEYFIYQQKTEWKNIPQVWAKDTFLHKFKYYKRLSLFAIGLKKSKYVNIDDYRQ